MSFFNLNIQIWLIFVPIPSKEKNAVWSKESNRAKEKRECLWGLPQNTQDWRESKDKNPEFLD